MGGFRSLPLPTKSATELKYINYSSFPIAGVGGGGGGMKRPHLPPPQFWLPNISKGSLAEQPQNFSKGAFGANIINFEGGAQFPKRA